MLPTLLPDAGSEKTNNEEQGWQGKSVLKFHIQGVWRGNSF